MPEKDDNPQDPQLEDTEMGEPEELIEEEEDPSETIFDGSKGYVVKDDFDRISQQGFYGTRVDDGRLELEAVEVLHLLERKRVIVKSPDGKPIDSKHIVNALLNAEPDLWLRYLVFRDLRSRGYAVRLGFGSGIDFRVYGRGDRPGTATAKQLVYVLKEGTPISLHDLDMVTEAASTARMDLVFALVDQNGEVNYYRVAQATLRNLRSDD
ncbi:MAG: tRNA-intron lyase [Candidatus Thorarchaeota archaeon]